MAKIEVPKVKLRGNLKSSLMGAWQLRGGASRTQLGTLIFLGAVAFAAAAIAVSDAFPHLVTAFGGPMTDFVAAALLLPFMAVAVRRLHDTGVELRDGF